ncbi:protein kinase domain containing protein [Stylonychia lemnae]|uniref:Protein kinase domain containing protein n=1 Tax=Stylonychia lemnae TaxID=5949 RepID=A0A078AJ81_STYLE|nr:protein kinase domain containing protein [Stylonychia lemnae]|eukprot:CDW82279.1 protein kinase domain containing protein [Stylonychia lemnae]
MESQSPEFKEERMTSSLNLQSLSGMQADDSLITEDQLDFKGQDESADKQNSWLTKRKNGAFKSVEYYQLDTSQSQNSTNKGSNPSSENSSPLKKGNQFSNRTKDFRQNLKGSLNLGLDRSKFQSSTSFSSVINMENITADEIQKIEQEFRNEFEKYYIEGKFIGEGCSAVVKECENRATGQKYAVKIMRNLDEERVAAAKNEFDLLKSLKHSNIVKVQEFFVTHKQIYMIMERVEGQELMDRISEIEKYDENIAKKLFRQALLAIEYLHENTICHRDIKPSNILVLNNKEKIKLTDFNISKLCKNKNFQMLTHTGTESFSAPEMFSSEVYNEKIDLWSAGCVLYTMLAGYQPANKLYKMIKEGIYDLEGETWQDISENAKDLIKKLLTVDPEQRLSAKEALNHPWVSVQEDKPFALSTVVTKMNQRKSIRLMDVNLNKLSENLYPNIDYSQIYQSLLQKGLDPIKQKRERKMSMREDSKMMAFQNPSRVTSRRKNTDFSIDDEAYNNLNKQQTTTTNENNLDAKSLQAKDLMGCQLSNIDEISDRQSDANTSPQKTPRNGSINAGFEDFDFPLQRQSSFSITLSKQELSPKDEIREQQEEEDEQ